MKDLAAKSNSWLKVGGALLALFLAVSMLLYVRRVLVPYQLAEAAAHDYPRGNLSDLYPRWLGARELLLHRRDPYSPEITREIEIGYYGRAIDVFRAGDPRDQQAFACPVYVVFLLAPFIYFPFEMIRIPFYCVLVFLLAATLIVWLRAIRWNASISTILTMVFLGLGSIPAIQGIELQQLTLPVTAALVGCAVLIRNGKFALAGGLLALASIKPQLSLPLSAWLTLWAACDWNRRKHFFISFFLTLAVLVAAAEWILPGWIHKFILAMAAYRQYTNAASLFDHLAGRELGFFLSVAMASAAVVICWPMRRDSEQSTNFVYAFALILAVTVAIIPSVSTYNQVLLFPGTIFMVHKASRLWQRALLARIVLLLAAAILCWPWISAFGLSAASFILPPISVQKAWALPFYTTLATPLVVLGLLFQYAFTIDRIHESATSVDIRQH